MNNQNEATSLTLLEQLRAANDHGWRRFIEQYGPLVYGWCRSRGIDSANAADIGQEVFTAVLRNIQDFQRIDEGSSFRGWLWMITHNKIRDYFRRLEREATATGGSTAQFMLAQFAADESLSISEAAIGYEGELARALEEVQRKVEPKTWSAFWRTTVEGAETADVARELATSTGAVRVYRFRVLKRLRETLARQILARSNAS